MTAQAIKTLAIVLLLVLLGLFGYAKWQGYQNDMTELAELRTYKDSVEVREEAASAARGVFQQQQEDATNQAAEITQQRIIIENRTIEVAREDQATADFLAVRIPERLRDADREARLARRLGAGDGAP